ncbi:tRNA pseudouridine(55) synthase TruB [Helicobacter pametensis]|uniref:tRNA pseudouridine(55) synthase TruB n=1 Tax=Helicobacter pametensis TaxID=95149 RepID=UPI00047F53D6|nr:tRNA pseudouridine(55) synthase TruB [Helicobacter pametensis]
MNALFAVDKPIGISSNAFLMRLKKKYGWKKCGYSGTLDPFASGLLIVGVGAYTRLFPYLDKSKKVYEATLWLGAKSESLDIEQVHEVQMIQEFELGQILQVLSSLKGKITYIPPKFSAKHINGKRAYELAREGVSFELKASEMEVFELELMGYSHPFLSFRVSVSEGGYIRSLGELIARGLGCEGSLSYLRRIGEGNVRLEGEMQELQVFEGLSLPRVDLSEFIDEIGYGKKFRIPSNYGLRRHQAYLAVFEEFFSIIEIHENNQVHYLLNRIPKC